MSIDHKAFIFDSSSFYQELRPIIESALISGSASEIRSFILSNVPFLVDPYEGEPLSEDWEDMIETPDVHQYGDFALTKYYSPTLDKGVGGDWEELQELFRQQLNDTSLILGKPLGTGENYFDPGKMGSYFQTHEDVCNNLHALQLISNDIPDRLTRCFEAFKEILNEAAAENKGLYVTF